MKKVFDFLKKLKNYFLLSKDDEKLRSFLKNKSKLNYDDGISTVIDLTHLSFKRWNIQLIILLFALNKLNKRNLIGFYPSSQFIWNTFQSKVIAFIKCFYNKDYHVFRLLKIQSILNPSLKEYYNSKEAITVSFKSKKELLDFEYKGIKIGDLIYDTYLKFYRKPTVNLEDRRLLELTSKAKFLVDYFQEKIQLHQVQEAYLTHSVYIGYGIFARVALNNSVKVFITQNNRGKEFHQLTLEHPLQTPDFTSYPQIFSSINNKGECYDLAKTSLDARFEGVIDSSIGYMKKTAYEVGTDELDFINHDDTNVLIMLHCFFDSPHIYKMMLYPDFYEWAYDSIEKALSAGFSVYVKEHPNGMPGNNKVVDQLKKSFPEAIFLDKSTSNVAILNSNIDAVLSVYGTLGHEFPYKGVPVINAGDNPHSAYDFCYNPKSIKEYHGLIAKIGKLNKITPEHIQNILEFYYIHNLHNSPGKNLLIDELIINGFSPKCDYDGLIKVIYDKGLETFIEASLNNYISLDDRVENDLA